MWTLLPALLLIIMAAIVAVIHRIKPNFGLSWLLSVLAAMIALGLMVAFHWLQPVAVGDNTWLPATQEAAQILFKVDDISWSYGISLLGLLLAVLLTAPVRLQYRSNPITWLANLAIGGAALLSVLAATPLTLVLTWTILDLIDLVVSMASKADARINRAAIISFAFRLTGSLLVVWAMGLSRAGGAQLLLNETQPLPAFFLLLAVGLRLGVLPLSLPYYAEALRRRGIGSMIRLASPIASLGILARLPDSVAPLDISPFLLALVGLAVIYGAGMWLASEDEVNGRQYWVIALAGMAVGSVIRGQPQASLAWGVIMILSGGLIFLYTTRPRISFIFPLLGLIGISGLPFTPAASGWAGMVTLPFSLPDVLFIIAHVILLLGYIRHFLRPGDQPSEVERWTRVAYSIGLFLLGALGWLVGLLGWSGSWTAGIWWASLISTLLAISIGVPLYFYLKKHAATSPPKMGWIFRVGAQFAKILSPVLRMSWLYRTLGWMYNLLQKLISLMSRMLEGAGGVLWVLVLLVLLITIVQASTN